MMSEMPGRKYRNKAEFPVDNVFTKLKQIGNKQTKQTNFEGRTLHKITKLRKSEMLSASHRIHFLILIFLILLGQCSVMAGTIIVCLLVHILVPYFLFPPVSRDFKQCRRLLLGYCYQTPIILTFIP